MPDWVEPVVRYMLETGLKNTLRTAAIAVVAATAIGVVLGTLITIKFWLSRALIRGYIEVWRGLPIIVTLFIVHFGLPVLSPRLEFDVFTSGIITLTLWGSAQIAEATRGAVQSIPREQHEASAALGLVVGIILNTTLIQVIGGSELLETAEQSYERLGSPPPVGLLDPHAFEILAFVAAVFFVICFPLTRLAAYLERRLVA